MWYYYFSKFYLLFFSSLVIPLKYISNENKIGIFIPFITPYWKPYSHINPSNPIEESFAIWDTARFLSFLMNCPPSIILHLWILTSRGALLLTNSTSKNFNFFVKVGYMIFAKKLLSLSFKAYRTEIYAIRNPSFTSLPNTWFTKFAWCDAYSFLDTPPNL